MVRSALLFALLVVPACFGDFASPFPPGLEPLEENTAPPPEPVDGDPYPEVLSAVYGTNNDYAWGHARGYVKAPSGEVWAALHDPAVLADRRRVTSFEATFDVDPTVDFSYRIHFVVERVVTIEWDLEYRLGVIEQDEAGPILAMLRWQKVYGTDFIKLLEGSVLVRRIGDGVTEVELIEHLDAAMSGEEDIMTYFPDLFADILARVRGNPLPEY